MTLKNDADRIIAASLEAAQPDTAVRKALAEANFAGGKLVLVAAGKAAWKMAKAAYDELGEKISQGVVITKYDHLKGPIGSFALFEAGHPVPDQNSYYATQKAIEAVTDLSAEDTVLFLLSGGGSALFEKPLIPEADLDRLTNELLACGAEITEMNTLRKRFSAVKGGKFAQICAPAKVFAVILSDIIGDPLDMIASGPACPDSTTADQAKAIATKYNISLTEQMKELLDIETPKELSNVETHITGSVRQLCLAAEKTCKELGYEPITLTANLACEARDAGTFLANIAQYHCNDGKSLAYIAGGETVVHLTGHGKGGRNQEIALSAAMGIEGMDNVAVFSLGSDGTDGPTDAAGGFVDGNTAKTLKEMGVNIFDVLQINDAYNALKKTDGLIITGPTGTNVNDISVLLINSKN